MNDFKIISEEIEGFIDNINKFSYFPIEDEENIWICHETGELHFIDSMKNVSRELLIDNNIIGNYIISRGKDNTICIGEVLDVEDDEDDTGDVLLVGIFLIFKEDLKPIPIEVISDLSVEEIDSWLIGEDYTEDLTVISEERYLEILKQINNEGNEEIFSMIDQLIYPEEYYTYNDDEDE